MLTASQLAHKRAKDREAQRAIRIRTKEYIERLEREIQNLKDQQLCSKPFPELLRRNAALEREVTNLRMSLALSSHTDLFSGVASMYLPLCPRLILISGIVTQPRNSTGPLEMVATAPRTNVTSGTYHMVGKRSAVPTTYVSPEIGMRLESSIFDQYTSSPEHSGLHEYVQPNFQLL